MIDDTMDMDDTSPSSDPGLEALRYLGAVLAQSDKSLRDQAWASVQRAETLNAIAESWVRDEATTNGMLAALEAFPGSVRQARALRGAVKRLVIEKKRAAATVASEGGGRELPSLAMCLGIAAPPPSLVDNAMLEQFRVPAGYAIDLSGVWKLGHDDSGDVSNMRIATAPIFIVGRTHDVLTGEAKRMVAWRTPAGWTMRAVARGMLMNAQKLIGLADLEAPVTSNTAAQLVGWFSEFEAENMHRFGAASAASRMGWIQSGGVKGFLLPDAFYTADPDADGMELNPPAGQETLRDGWKPAGTWEGWLDAIEPMREHAPMWIALYASAAAPLLEIVGCPSFVVDICGETTGGKTTALRVAASVWGRPSDNGVTAMYSWDSTKVYIERLCGFLCNLPVILDETKRAKNAQIVRDVIYDFANGQGRGRGNIEGTRATTSWRTVLLSSGESAAVQFSQDGGTRARVITVSGKPLGRDGLVGSRAAEHITSGVVQNYGFLGRKVVQYLLAAHDQHEDLRRIWEESRTYFAAAAKVAITKRQAQYLAVLHMAAEIVHQLGVPQPVNCDPLTVLVESMLLSEDDADRPAAAMSEVISWCAANQTRFWGRHTMRDGVPVEPTRGWAGSWESGTNWSMIHLRSAVLREVLEEAGFDYEEIVARWSERNWVKLGGRDGREKQVPVSINGVKMRCYAIGRQAVDMVMNSYEMDYATLTAIANNASVTLPSIPGTNT